ncbi:cysteine dioxygenase [Roseomonas chloroacetimidivorans]|uniref:cysteine dioxygenase family protein n=1 Tax=Roseomonas chloroacetimidivorans TaxID=1766656 RepID=UPI003C795A71
MGITKLAAFVRAVTEVVDQVQGEAALLDAARPLLARLIAVDDWLPESCAAWSPQYYRQHLIYRDPAGRFSLVSFVWGPGQATPIHDHTVWGLIGMLRGAEISTNFERTADGQLLPSGAPVRLEPGDIEAVSPSIGDIHRVTNAFDDRVSISIHLYGADIGTVRRHVFLADGSIKEFISGYSSEPGPDLLRELQR